MRDDYLRYFPPNFQQKPKCDKKNRPVFEKSLEDIIPDNQNAPFDMYDLIDRIIDEDSFCEIKKLFAPELITALARINGEAIGIVANQPRVKGGVLFHDSADKAAKFITLCDAFHIPLLFLADIPGFMIGTKVEQAGIIRHGAKMISAMSEATVPKIIGHCSKSLWCRTVRNGRACIRTRLLFSSSDSKDCCDGG